MKYLINLEYLGLMTNILTSLYDIWVHNLGKIMIDCYEWVKNISTQVDNVWTPSYLISPNSILVLLILQFNNCIFLVINIVIVNVAVNIVSAWGTYLIFFFLIYISCLERDDPVSLRITNSRVPERRIGTACYFSFLPWFLVEAF